MSIEQDLATLHAYVITAPSDPRRGREALARVESELERLREGLRRLRERAAPRDWETPGHPMNEWTKREPILREIDALLADQGGAK